MFQGFSQSTQDFLWGIRFNNEKSWFLAHKEDYLTHVSTPMADLGRELITAMGEEFPQLQLNLHISRIYRDARRLHGRGPYKDHLWLSLRPPVEDRSTYPVFYFEIAPEFLSMGMGCYCPPPLTMLKLRTRIDHNPQPLEKLARQLERDGRFQLDGSSYKRSKGEPSPLLTPWYNRKSIGISRDFNWEETVFSPDLTQEILQAFRFLVPYYQYLFSLNSDPDPRED